MVCCSIEHLEDEVLAKFPSNVFGQINPKVVILTTPNAEFNVLFPNFSGFRHPDHKFEWTRSQFQDWYVSVLVYWWLRNCSKLFSFSETNFDKIDICKNMSELFYRFDFFVCLFRVAVIITQSRPFIIDRSEIPSPNVSVSSTHAARSRKSANSLSWLLSKIDTFLWKFSLKNFK